MAKIYGGVEGIAKPQMSEDFNDDLKAEEEYIKKIVEYAKKANLCPEAGKELDFPVADGYARYIVLSLKPVQLIHLDVGDAWQYHYVNRLTASDIRKEIKNRETLEELFK